MKTVSLTFPLEEAGKYDVLVVGGGLSGCCAAIAASRSGAKTLLAESLPYIGGNGTTGLPISSFRAANNPRLVVGGIPLELLLRLKKKGALQSNLDQVDWICLDYERLQIEMTHMLDEAGVEMITHAPLVSVEHHERRLNAALLYSKDSLLRYEAKVFVDSSGDAQLANLAGLPTPVGRQRDSKTQPMTLMFTLGGIEDKHLMSWAETALKWEELRTKRGGWLNPRLGPALSGGFPIPGKPGVWSFNVTRIIVDKGTDSRLLTQAEKQGRYQVEEFVESFLRPHIPGYEKCYLTQIAGRVGVRETRRIVGHYELQKSDLVAQRKFSDAIACNSYPVDIHSPDGGSTHYEEGSFPNGAYYTIPYGCLVARDADNLLASGRCLSASHEALAAVRVLSAAMATGEAAGTAAALCSQNGQIASKIDRDILRGRLREQNAIVD